MRSFMSRTIVSCAAALLSAVAVQSAGASPITVTYQEGVNGYAMAGTGIRTGANTGVNYGANPGYVVGWTAGTGAGTGTILRVVSDWALTGIPTNATVTDVTISYKKLIDANGVNASYALMLYTLTSSFDEGTKNGSAGFPADAGAANWTQRTPLLNWTTPGGDFAPVVLAQTTANPRNADPFAFTGSGATNPLVQAVQAAVSSQTGFKYLMKTVESNDGTRVVFQVNADDYSNLSERPALSITYVVPEPASLGLLGLGGLLMLARRRKA